MLGVLDVDELLVHGRGVVESGLPAAVHAGHRRPDADGAPEVIGHVHRHHVLHAQAEVCGALDLRRRVTIQTFYVSVPVDSGKIIKKMSQTSIVLMTGWPISWR